MCLIAGRGGTIRAVPGEQKVRRLATFEAYHSNHRTGDGLAVTTDLMTSPGDVWLAGDQRERLFEDYRRIREIEAEGFFDVGQ